MSWIREAERHEAKSERLEKREMELAAEWQKHRAQQQAEIHASSPQTSLEDYDPEISVKPLAILREHTLDTMEEKMVTKGMLIASVIIPLISINFAFLCLCAAAIIDIWKK